jgi:D,D-heptose 1,7-bisphosphate phosphatase
LKTVIMAGGKGSRISSLAADIPKPMIKMVGKPVLEHQLECLKKQDLIDIILVTGHLGNVIKNHFKSGSSFGVNIEYFDEKEPLGTAGALFFLQHLLKEDFFLLNGDIIFDINFNRFYEFHRTKNAMATILTHPNNHPYDSALIVTDENNKVVDWLHKEDERLNHKNRVNAGIHILSPSLIGNYLDGGKKDLDRDILKPLILKDGLFAYDSPEYVGDMGTPERFSLICNDIVSGKVESRNIGKKQKAIFLDRDGTINQYCGFITKPNQIRLLPGVAEAISLINKSEYLAIVITNQPVIARGECTFQELDEIHNRIETLLGEKGAYLDAIYYCPHHPDKGFAGERVEFKIECECRKPKPGLIARAAKDYNIDISASFMVGDSPADIQAGQAAGCKTVYLTENSSDEASNATYAYSNLLSFVEKML